VSQLADILVVDDLHTHYSTPQGTARVLNGVSLRIRPGEVLGLVGESGAGKSVLARSILNLIDPPGRVVKGRVLFDGQDLLTCREPVLRALRGNAIGLIVPNPHLHLNPVVTIGEQIANVIRAHRDVSRHEAMAEAVRYLEKVGLPDPATQARSLPHELSGGMAQRVIIVMSLVNSPKLLLADEPSGGLDVTVQLQILELMRELVTGRQTSMLLISRDLGIVAHYCDRVAVLYAGQIIEEAPVDVFFAEARHPYSLELLRLGSPKHMNLQRLGRGDPALNPIHRPTGCPFHPRCLLAIDRCKVDMPETDVLGDHHSVRCHLARRSSFGASS